MTNKNHRGNENYPSGRRTNGSPSGERDENQPRDDAARSAGCAGQQPTAREETAGSTIKTALADGGGVTQRVRAAAEGLFSTADQQHPDVDVGVAIDDVYTVLANRRRRHVIQALADSHGTLTIGELSDDIAASEHDGPGEPPNRKAVYVTLHQHHFPTLGEADVLEYDERANKVHATEATLALAGVIHTINATVNGGGA